MLEKNKLYVTRDTLLVFHHVRLKFSFWEYSSNFPFVINYSLHPRFCGENPLWRRPDEWWAVKRGGTEAWAETLTGVQWPALVRAVDRCTHGEQASSGERSVQSRYSIQRWCKWCSVQWEPDAVSDVTRSYPILMIYGTQESFKPLAYLYFHRLKALLKTV